MLLRHRKAFTLLELMVAFIIMAILSAIAVPSLLGVVNGDQTSADQTSAGSIVDAAYYTATSGAPLPGGAPSYFPVDAAEAYLFVPAGTRDTIYKIVAGYYNDPLPTLQFTFSDGNVIYVAAPQSNGAGSPTVLGGATPSGAAIGGGTPPTFTNPDNNLPVLVGGPAPSSGDSGGGAGTTSTTTTTTTTTTPTTTTTAAYTEPTCSLSVTGPYVANHIPSAYSVSCSGVTGASVQLSAVVPGGTVFLEVDSANYIYNGTKTALASSFTIDQSYTNPTDASVPSAAVLATGGSTSGGGYIEFVAAGTLAPFPDSAIGQVGPGGPPYYGQADACEISGTDCGIPSVTLTGFPVEGTSVAGSPDCTVSVTGPWVAFSAPTAYSVTCTGVTGSRIAVNVPVPGGIFRTDVIVADAIYSADGYPSAAFPSTVTWDQSTVAATDDSVPSAIGSVTATFYGSGYASPTPDDSISEIDTTGAQDSCWHLGTGCATPTYTLTGF